MAFKYSLFFLLSVFSNLTVGQTNVSEFKSVIKISKQEIYDVIQIIVDQSNLKKDQRLILSAKFDAKMNKSFLEKFLIDSIIDLPKENSNKLIRDSITGKFIVPKLDNTYIGRWPKEPKVLTNRDISYMLALQNDTLNLKWDNTILNFNQKNKDKWYTISIPLFTEDKTKFFVSIEDGCKGLCGTGETYIFTKMENGWKKETVSHWVH